MSEEQDQTPAERRKAAQDAYKARAKEMARERRQADYQRAKAYSKAVRLERKNSPQAQEMKERLKEKRRQAAAAAKEARQQKAGAAKAATKREAAEIEALKHADLQATLVPASSLPPPRAKLRLVRSEE